MAKAMIIGMKWASEGGGAGSSSSSSSSSSSGGGGGGVFVVEYLITRNVCVRLRSIQHYSILWLSTIVHPLFIMQCVQ
jgi:hypothetical protein